MTGKPAEMASSLSQRWRSSGIESGDTVLIHSSLKRTLTEYGVTAVDVMESLLDAVGAEGTMVFPLFNFDFTRGVPFDVRMSPSKMGALTEAARTHPGAVRSGHPIYSFAAIGKNAAAFNVDNASGYGDDSPFGILRTLGGKIAVLDLDDQNSMTFYHHVEEMHQVPYRYFKHFTAPYTDWEGNTTNRTYKLFVRDLEKGVLTDVNRMGELLWEKGLYIGDRPKEGTGLRTILATDLFREVSDVIKSGRALGMLYSIESKP